MEVINYLKRVNGSGHIVEHVGFHESGDYMLRLLFSESDKPFRQHKYEVEKEYSVIDKAEVNALERQTCGRRMVDFGPWEKRENIDIWTKMPNGDRCCSFCGSIHPSDLIEIVKSHGRGAIEFTNKSYKWYVHRPGVSNAMQGGIKYYRYHDTEAFVKELNEIFNAASAE